VEPEEFILRTLVTPKLDCNEVDPEDTIPKVLGTTIPNDVDEDPEDVRYRVTSGELSHTTFMFMYFPNCEYVPLIEYLLWNAPTTEYNSSIPFLDTSRAVLEI